MSATQLKRVRYTHDAMIDLMIAQPGISQNALASEFGYQPAWISTVVNSDAFQLRLEQRKAELIDPVLRASIEDRLRATTVEALKVIQEKLMTDGATTIEEATKALSVTSRALGYGLRQPDSKVAVTQYVAFLATTGARRRSVGRRQPPAPRWRSWKCRRSSLQREGTYRTKRPA